ncbi:MAG: 50S ribosomal protein L4 [Patescibacteria group bacterium]
MKATIYTQEGKENGSIELADSMFGLAWNGDLVKQVVDSMLSSRRKPVAHTKGRGEVRGGGKKPWKQKGTGRARHGSIRSPIWRGGGVTHGPTNEKIFERKISKKMKAKALLTILSQKLREGEVLFVDSLVLSAPKTKEATKVLMALSKVKGFEKMSYKKGSRALLAVPAHDAKLARSFRNIASVGIDEARNMNPVDLLRYKYLVIARPEESLKTVEGRLVK